MAFSIRKMLSNINYFKKLEDEEEKSQNENSIKKRRHTSSENSLEQANTEFEHIDIEADSTSFTLNQDKPESSQEGSINPNNVEVLKPKMHKNKKLKLDMVQTEDDLDSLSKDIGEPNTPKVVTLGLSTTEKFSKRLQNFDMSKSFDLFDDFDNVDALSTNSDSDASLSSDSKDKTLVKMCRKVDSLDDTAVENRLTRSTTPESFADVEAEGNDDERLVIINSYKSKIEKIDYVLKNILTDFQFHIEISKIFSGKAIVPSNKDSLLQLSQLIDVESRIDSPIDWNLITEKEDNTSKRQIKTQLVTIRDYIDNFLKSHLKTESRKSVKSNVPSIMYRENYKRLRVSRKKKQRRLDDFPDFNEALRKLFSLDGEDVECSSESPNCLCECHQSTLMEESSIKDDTNYSIYSSIGNFTLDSATLTVFSESLDNIIDFSSFEESNLYSSMLNKSSIVRLTFYIQVHNIHVQGEGEIQASSQLKFTCVTCGFDTEDENVILRHVLSQSHCEKIHFLYKSAYIKKCLSSGKEMQPSTVLNPMTMYRDLNKIVCFGDAMYACSLCFESLIVGESVLMAHCSDVKHVEKRGMLKEFMESFEV